jgi:hypothetical protein
MRKIVFIAIFVFAYIFVFACDPQIVIEGKEKTKYKKNDEVIVKLTITLTHRNCQLNIVKDTKYEQEGIKILSATDWKEIEPGVWERKFKIKITADKGQTAKFTVIRSCSKGGCNKSITFPT